MIVGNINNAQKDYMLNEAFKDAFEYLKTLDVDSKGGFEFYNFKGGVSSYETSDYTADGKLKPIEAHKDYIDIHFVIDGSEGIGYADIETLTPITDYNKEKDYILLDGNMSKIILQKGEFFDKDFSYAIKNAFLVRQESDYEDFYVVSKSEAIEQLENAYSN